MNQPRNCNEETCELVNYLLNFFGRFETEHDISRGNIQTIVPTCDALYDSVNSLKAKENVTSKSVSQLYSDATQFVTEFGPNRIAVLNNLVTAQDSINKLLYMKDCFISSHKLICDVNCSRKGCEADRNQLQCDALNFFESLPVAGALATNNINGITKYIARLDELVWTFNKENRLTCESTGSACNLSSNFPRRFLDFFVEFESPHTKSRKLLYEVSGLCDEVYNGINDWQDKLVELSTTYCSTL